MYAVTRSGGGSRLTRTSNMGWLQPTVHNGSVTAPLVAGHGLAHFCDLTLTASPTLEPAMRGALLVGTLFAMGGVLGPGPLAQADPRKTQNAYQEILTGQYQPDVTSNGAGQ